MIRSSRVFSILLLSSVFVVTLQAGTPVSMEDRLTVLEKKVAKLEAEMPVYVNIDELLKDIQEEFAQLQQKESVKYQAEMEKLGKDRQTLDDKAVNAKDNAKVKIEMEKKELEDKARAISQDVQNRMMKEQEKAQAKAQKRVQEVITKLRSKGHKNVLPTAVKISNPEKPESWEEELTNWVKKELNLNKAK